MGHKIKNKALWALAAGTCVAISAAAVAQPGDDRAMLGNQSLEAELLGGPKVDGAREQDRLRGRRGGQRGGEFVGRGKRGKHGSKLPAEVKAEIVRALDTNGDGELSKEERQAGRETARGLIEAHRQAVRADRRAEIVAKFDADGDGELGDAERETAKAAMRAHREGQREAKRARMLERFDTDGDGELSKEERQSARESVRERHQQRKAEALERFDADGDGKLTGDEREAAKAAYKQRVTGRKHVALLDGDKSRSIDEQELAVGLELVAGGDANADFNGDGVTDELDAERLIQIFEHPRSKR